MNLLTKTIYQFATENGGAFDKMRDMYFSPAMSPQASDEDLAECLKHAYMLFIIANEHGLDDMFVSILTASAEHVDWLAAADLFRADYKIVR